MNPKRSKKKRMEAAEDHVIVTSHDVRAIQDHMQFVQDMIFQATRMTHVAVEDGQGGEKYVVHTATGQVFAHTERYSAMFGAVRASLAWVEEMLMRNAEAARTDRNGGARP